MNNLKDHIPILLILLSILFVCAACEKIVDENGYSIVYYKNKTATGYCFYYYTSSNAGSFDNLFRDSIAPAPNKYVSIESIVSWGVELWGGSKEHKDVVFTDEFGKYSFRIVKTIDGKKLTGYFIEPSPATVPSLQSFSYDDFSRHNYIQLDTFFICVFTPHHDY